MGKVVSKVKLTNYDDLVRCRNGVKSEAEVCQVEVDALIDTGATMLSLPQDLVEKLGLFVPDKEVVVTYTKWQQREEKNRSRS
jgi:predicted aspartyl protease